MNILFDLMTPQSFIGGAGEYVRKVFMTLLDYRDKHELGQKIKIFGLFNSDIERFSYVDLCPDAIRAFDIVPVDIANSSLKKIISDYRINKVFIGAAQYWGDSLDVESITCPCICVIHDLCYEEYNDSHLQEMLELPYSWLQFTKKSIGKIKRKLLGQYKDPLSRMKKIMAMAEKNSNVEIVLVSYYSLNSFQYHFNFPQDKLHVLYSCPRLNNMSLSLESPELKRLIDERKKYYFFMSADRKEKNPIHLFNAFSKFVESGNKDCFLVTTGCKDKMFENHIPLGYLSDGDVYYAMHNCYALLFPSFMEGFGYPPIEAMGVGKPVLCSNVTSIPEICSNAAIYFSPLYESDIFRALRILNDNNYQKYADLAKSRFIEITKIQEAHLNELIQLIIREIR